MRMQDLKTTTRSKKEVGAEGENLEHRSSSDVVVQPTLDTTGTNTAGKLWVRITYTVISREDCRIPSVPHNMIFRQV